MNEHKLSIIQPVLAPFHSNASSAGTVMARHLPIYVPDSDSRNCLKKAKSPFYPVSLLVFCTAARLRYFLKTGFITGFWKTLSFSFIVLNGIYKIFSNKCTFSSCLIIQHFDLLNTYGAKASPINYPHGCLFSLISIKL